MYHTFTVTKYRECVYRELRISWVQIESSWADQFSLSLGFVSRFIGLTIQSISNANNCDMRISIAGEDLVGQNISTSTHRTRPGADKAEYAQPRLYLASCPNLSLCEHKCLAVISALPYTKHLTIHRPTYVNMNVYTYILVYRALCECVPAQDVLCLRRDNWTAQNSRSETQ